MKMKIYSKPVMNITQFDVENIVTASDPLSYEYKFETKTDHYGASAKWSDVNKTQQVQSILAPTE